MDLFKINEDSNEECLICLDKDNLQQINCCNKVFHIKCLIRWIETSNNTCCPHCKECMSDTPFIIILQCLECNKLKFENSIECTDCF
jgi:hypothetical protein